MERLKAPLSVNIWLTGKCNLNCEYCYSFPSEAGHLPINTLINLIEECDSMKVFEMHLGGGEPFMHPDIFTILDRIFTFKDQIVILTNGVLLTREKCERLAGYLKQGKYVDLQISLDAHLPEVNDSVRGKTEKTVAAIEYLAELGLNPQIAVVVHKKNVDVALDMIDYFYPRVKRFHYMNLMPSRKVNNNAQEQDLSLDRRKRRRFWKKFDEKVATMPPDLVASGATDKEYLDIENPWFWPGCLAGVTRCDIDSNLNVAACNIAGDVIIGNLKDKTLEEIWSSPLATKIGEIPYPLCSEKGLKMAAKYIEEAV